MVLEQWIRPETIQRRVGNSEKWIRRPGDQKREKRRAGEPRPDGIWHIVNMLTFCETRRTGDVETKDQAPEENRAFERGPETDDRHPRRHLARSDMGNIADREIVR